MDIVVPEQIGGKPVLKLSNTFLDGLASDTSMMRKVVRSITARSVTTLEEGMGFWRELYSLEVLVLPRVERIWDHQFQDAVSLKYIDLSCVTYIGDYAFGAMSGCDTVVLGRIGSISSAAFTGASITTVRGEYNAYAETWAHARDARYEPIAQ